MSLRDYIKTPKDRAEPYNKSNLVLRTIFSKKSFLDKSRNLLNHIEGFSHVTLKGRHSIDLISQYRQGIFYVAKGRGKIMTEDKEIEIKKDSAFIIPAYLPYSISVASSKQSLEMLVISEEAPTNQNKKIIIKNTSEIPFDGFNPSLHWCHRSKTIFSYDKDNLSKVHYFSLVYIDKNKLPEPHTHFLGHDEIWHALEGKTIMALKDNLVEHAPGTSILIPDNGEIPHASITGKEPAKFLFIMHHMALDNRLLITGSRGTIGSVITQYLRNNGYQFITELDRDNPENPIDILKDDINPYFKNIDTIIHLAANPNPFIEKKEADKNIELTKRVIEACDNYNPKRIINASSINVYPYRTIGKITRETSLTSNTHFNPEGYYGKAKIESERLLEQYCRENNVSLLNLRLGWVTKNDTHPPYKEDNPHPRDLEVALKHEDLKKIIRRAIDYNGMANYVCVSKRKGFIDDGIIFHLD